MVEAKRQLLADCINRMGIDVLKERLSYRDHGDLDQLLDVTLPAIRYVLLFAADLLGHNAVSGRSAFRESDELHSSLEKAGAHELVGDVQSRSHAISQTARALGVV